MSKQMMNENVMTNNEITSPAPYFWYNHPRKKIVGKELNFRKSGNPGSAQDKALMCAKKEHPDYYITERQFSNAELRLLVECIYNADFMSRSDADLLTAKILGLASRPDRETLADKQDEDKKSQTGSSVMKNIEIISQAIEQKRKIQFVPMQYVARRTTHTARYNFTHTVSPKKLTWKQGRCTSPNTGTIL